MDDYIKQLDLRIKRLELAILTLQLSESFLGICVNHQCGSMGLHPHWLPEPSINWDYPIIWLPHG